MRRKDSKAPTAATPRLDELALDQLRVVAGGDLGDNRGNGGRTDPGVLQRGGWGDGTPGNAN